MLLSSARINQVDPVLQHQTLEQYIAGMKQSHLDRAISVDNMILQSVLLYSIVH